MRLDELYNIAEKQNIDVDYFPMDECTSVSTPYGIAIDVDKLNNSIEEKVCLAHELGHCELGAFYNIFSPYDIKSRQEYRANKWAASTLIPFCELQEALESGYTEIWELAELFGVSEEFMNIAIDIYRRQGKLL